jgi:hypothetical protein
MDKIMETLGSVGIKNVCVGCTESTLVVTVVRYFFVCLLTLCSASVNGLRIVFSNSSSENAANWKTCQNFKEDRFLVRV